MMCIFGKVFCTFDIRRNSCWCKRKLVFESSRLEIKSKTLFFHLHFAHLFVILALPNLLPFGKAKAKKSFFPLHFAHLFVILQGNMHYRE